MIQTAVHTQCVYNLYLFGKQNPKQHQKKMCNYFQ
jgi:hypothetical protein